jgi:formylglycine-generating enzyme required for sulfatase activity
MFIFGRPRIFVSSYALLLTLFLLPQELLAQEVTVVLPGGVPLTLVKVPAGTFLMGSPEGERGNILENETQHQVTLTHDYYLGKTEVTVRQWGVVTRTPMPTECSNFRDDNNPVSCVNWDQIAGPGGFVEKLNQHLETTGFRLPTEAEWERAARAGTTTRFAHGDVLECNDECEYCDEHWLHIWYCGFRIVSCVEIDPDDPGTCLRFVDFPLPRTVGLTQPNPFGLYDMHGNVWEWVQDRYGDYSPDDVTDPTGPTIGTDRVIRGGSWAGEARLGRSASRAGANPETFGIPANTEIPIGPDGFGFRIAISSLDGLPFQINAGLNGNWWSGPARDGEGAQIEVADAGGGDLVFVATIYSYDDMGNQIFLVAVSTSVSGDTAEVDVFITEGGLWGADFDPNDVNVPLWGTGTFTASDCGSLHMALMPNTTYKTLGYTDMMFDLIRLTTPLIPCPLDSPN